MRKYQKIWELLKDRKACCVEVHRLIAPRVVKAVIKEKDADKAFKLVNPLERPYLAIERIALVDGKHIRLQFTLKQRYGLADIVKPGKAVNLTPEEVGL